MAMTLPVVWVVSLTVRIAAQHLAIGEDSLEFQTKLGPTGNLSTDYEFIRPVQILRYSLAGHAATLFLIVLGMVITSAVLPGGQTPNVTQSGWAPSAALLDVHGGWGSLAWASQIMWVNLLIGALNLLPTVPFDNRALLYGLSLLRRRANEPSVLRSLADFNSHLAVFFVGVGLAILGLSILHNVDSLGWYAVTAVGVYLFVASRWERSRAEQLEQQFFPLGDASRVRHHRQTGSRHHRHEPSEVVQDAEIPSHVASMDPAVVGTTAPRPERKMHVSEAYLDEILRKLHREGTASLSIREQEALLTASQKLKEKHRSK